MTAARHHVHFYLNDTYVRLDDVRADASLLDFLRIEKRLTGTKEGCAEGDCGACTVLVGRVEAGGLRYHSVNACITLLPMLDGTHVVTVEALSRDGTMHWIQDALWRHHGSQCGFCTPGIVMSLYAMWMNTPDPEAIDIEVALQGNLCRCTGYAPIIRGVLAAKRDAQLDDDPLVRHRDEMREKLAGLEDNALIQISGEAPFYIPATPEQLAHITEESPRFVAGATDVGLWITKHFKDISPAIFLHRMKALKTVDINDEGLTIGGMVSYTAFQSTIAAHYPWLAVYWRRIGGAQVRNAGTIGGNIANGSPIGDTPPILIAMGTEITLNRRGVRRRIALEDFFIDYGKQDRAADEIVECIHIPHMREDMVYIAEKVSKRRDEDISAVAAGFVFRVENGHISSARLGFGGMAATPKRAKCAEGALTDQPWSEAGFRAAMDRLDEDFAPLTDARATASYRMAVAKNLLLKAFYEHQNDH